jgi:hypothetical protein
MQNYEYRVCAAQSTRVTFVNGLWQGSLPPTTEDTNAALESCPNVWDYLRDAGSDGWELVAAQSHHHMQGVMLETIYLKRPSW